jgi:hypothetical protein
MTEDLIIILSAIAGAIVLIVFAFLSKKKSKK